MPDQRVEEQPSVAKMSVEPLQDKNVLSAADEQLEGKDVGNKHAGKRTPVRKTMSSEEQDITIAEVMKLGRHFFKRLGELNTGGKSSRRHEFREGFST